MAALTPNYEFNLPEEGADTDLWGGLLNENWAGIDTLLKTMRDELEQQITDAIEAARIKVGDLYFSADADDPATKLGYGTWVAHAAGRAIVGVGSNGQSTWTPDQARGSETHALTQAELPAHGHIADPPYTETTLNGQHGHYGAGYGFLSSGTAAPTGNLVSIDISSGSKDRANVSIPEAGNHIHGVEIAPFWTQNTGNNAAHNNIQPSIGVYVWKRTA